MQNAGAARRDPQAGGATATLADVDIRGELRTRPRRCPNYEAESRALAMLAREMATNPRNMLQKLVEMAADLCGADTAGISLLDGDLFRWEAVAGVFAAARGGTMPRTESPSGICIERDATQLMHFADRCFPALYAEPRFVEVLLIPFHGDRAPIGTVWIVSHTDDRKFDAEDERVITGLAQFASAAWQLWKSYEAAAEASTRKSDFLAIIGHELRNPLAAITTAAAMIRLRTTDGAETTLPLDVIARQCQHMVRLVDDLLDVARVEKQKLQLEKQRVDVRTIVAEAVEAMRCQIEHHQHVLETEFGSDPILLDIDPVRMAQVISNLVDNAAKYTPDGGTITVMISQTGREVHIAVRDTGHGLPAEQLTNIFTPFTQLDGSSRAGRAGLGLGLPLVRSLAELHGGTVHAASAGTGHGSCFTVRLPLPPMSKPEVADRERRGEST
jgi:signal transduction histidine kinase